MAFLSTPRTPPSPPPPPTATTKNTQFLVKSPGAPLTASSTNTASLGPTQLLIRIVCVAINPADVKMIDHGARVQSWPLIAGLDGAGVVDAVGAGVRRFCQGDAVMAAFSAGGGTAAGGGGGGGGGSFQEFAVVEERMVAGKPEGWSFQEAAGVSVCYITALVGLALGLGITNLPFLANAKNNKTSQSQPQSHPQQQQKEQKQKEQEQKEQEQKKSAPPKSVLVLGGSSAVGAAATQLLRLTLSSSPSPSQPAVTILATASPRHHAHITTYLGATHAVDYHQASPGALVDEIKRHTADGAGVDAILDAVAGAGEQPCVFDALRSDGPRRYAQVWTGAEPVQVPEGDVVLESVVFRSRDLPLVNGWEGAMEALERLTMEGGGYKVPLPVRVVDPEEGEDDGGDKRLAALKRGLDLVRSGVSGKKIIVNL